MALLNRVYARVKGIARRFWVPSQFWLPSEEEMERIAEGYGIEIEIIPSIIRRKLRFLPIWVKAEGFASYKERLIQVVEGDYRIFWHELGHIIMSIILRGWKPTSLDILSGYFFFLIVAVVLSISGFWSPFWIFWLTLIAFVCYVLNELLATWVGLQLSRQWREKIKRKT